jgi:F420-0:gamma-glutamyl ligase
VEVVQAAILPMRVRVPYVAVDDSIENGVVILLAEIPSLASVPLAVAPDRDDRLMQLAQAVNTTFKGLVAVEGQGGHIAKSVIPIKTRLQPESGEESLLGEIVESLSSADLRDGDVVVVSESLFAIAQGRLFPLKILYECDPKTTDDAGREIALARIQEFVPDTDMADLLCADALPEQSPPMATAGMRDPNGVAFDLAERLRNGLGRRCDIVISDTDTGLEVRKMLIGCITIGSTPLGATGGLVLYECMRVASAAEFCRGASRGIPVVICRPHQRRAARPNIGQPRGYAGRLSFERERLIGYS